MFGKNKISKPKNNDGSNLDIVKIFSTIQGEGPYAGHPAIFIRLGGCNLQCKFCDTEFDDFVQLSLSTILKKIIALKPHTNQLIVITGGEPLIQPIEKLCTELINRGFRVQIETNGTIKRKLPKNVDIICSPKNNSGKYKITKDLDNFINCYKFIISKTNEDYNFVPTITTQKPIYVQPMDEYNDNKNAENMKFTVELAKKNNYIVSLQTHKILQIE